MAKALSLSLSQSLTRTKISFFLLFVSLCSLSYLFASYKNSKFFVQTPKISIRKGPPRLNLSNSQRPPSAPLDSEGRLDLSLPPSPVVNLQPLIEFCPANFTDYCPCQDPRRERLFHTGRYLHRERHCPGAGERVRCLIPRPKGYRTPFLWPKSKDYAWFANAPYKRLTESKKNQNWVRLVNNLFVFPGGGTSFPNGVKGYVDGIAKVVPLRTGEVRTVLDVGCGLLGCEVYVFIYGLCGYEPIVYKPITDICNLEIKSVASFGAYLTDFGILTMSLAPRDVHEAQVQFALERGLPAMLGVLSTYRLPYPARSFDMSHCSRCLVKWADYDGLFLIEIDRILRPGGYWVLSGPPINWRKLYRGWERQPKDLEQEQASIEDLARKLCWKKIIERGPFAVWQKPTNHVHCRMKSKVSHDQTFCADYDPDSAWYRNMESCITSLPEVKDIQMIAGGALKKWPERLNAAPPRIINGNIEGITVKIFNQDNQLWSQRVVHYSRALTLLAAGRYRNIMDMNAGLGGFAAALSKYAVWVMNVVPSDAKNKTLGAIYERGLIGTYMDWCEAFSTYPRTYDLIHADGILSMYMDKCDILDILLEMDRILRPEGAVIIRDHVDVIVKVKSIADRLRWHSWISQSENGALSMEKILFVDNSVSKTNAK
ncbi:hypothetical protein ACLOJK_011935 [Asimina triloba]